MLIPLADIFFALEDNASSAQRRKLRRWLFATAFRRTYSRGANTEAVKDAVVLRDWVLANGVTPDVVAGFRLDPDELSTVSEGNDIVTRAVVAALTVDGAEDWEKHDGRLLKLVDLDGIDLAIHHVFPQKVIRDKRRLATTRTCQQIKLSSTRR